MKAPFDIGRSAVLALALAAAPASAEMLPNQEVTLYFGQGVDANLPDLPGKAASGKLDFDKTWFTGAGFAYPDTPASFLRAALGWVGLENSTSSKEFVVVKHHGLQRQMEWGALYLLRTPFLDLSPVRLRIGAGLGLSYAWGTPAYEDGPYDDPSHRYRLQNFDAYELETGIAALPHWAFVGRVHHRSGAYGLIAPRNVGSNFLTASVRYEY